MHRLPELPYPTNALEPHIDAKTMEIHHGKHHAAYVAKLNEALEKFPKLNEKKIELLLKEFQQVPEEIKMAVRNHGGGHANHALFWSILGPKCGGKPDKAPCIVPRNSRYKLFSNQEL